MDIIKQFGQDDTYYQFPAGRQQSIRGDFGDVLPVTVRPIGIDGGFNTNGRSRPRSGVGNVQVYFWLLADDASAMQAKRNSILKMLGWGHQRLFKEMGDGTLVWTWGIVNNISMPQSARDVPHTLQQVQVNFQCEKARWYGLSGYVLNSDGTVTDGTTPQVNGVSVNNGSTVDVTNNGTAPAGAYIKLVTGAGVTVQDFTISRDVGAVTVDSVQWNTTLAGSSTLEIDARDASVYENLTLTASYGNLVTESAAWLSIPPGTHTLDIAGTFSANATLTVKIWDTYY